MLESLSVTTELEKHRQEFPALANKFYFNFGGQGTLPRAALEAIIETHNYLQQDGPFSLRVNAWIQQRSEAIRDAIAQELGVAAKTITFTENVTAGCNIALWGIDWQAGDRILMTDCEHPGIIAIVEEIARRFGVEIDTCPILGTLNEGDPTAIISQWLNPKTRLVILSHLLWNTGQVLPLAEIVAACHNYSRTSKQVRVLVDAAQSVGSLPLNLSGIGVDYYAFTGHKWLCGPAGVGGLYISPEAFEELQPTFVGWRAVDLNDRGQLIGWKNDGQRFEVATSAYPEYEGLRGAIATHQQWGTSQERYQKICRLSEYLWQSLARIEGIQCLKTSAPEAGLVSFQVMNHPHAKLVGELEERGYLLRTIADPDCIRACVHYFTLPSEIEQLVSAIEQTI
jgi:L-cysteine/cystine lyase